MALVDDVYEYIEKSFKANEPIFLSELKKRLINYMKKNGIEFDNMKPYLQYYPERIYQNMYEVDWLRGISI